MKIPLKRLMLIITMLYKSIQISIFMVLIVLQIIGLSSITEMMSTEDVSYYNLKLPTE